MGKFRLFKQDPAGQEFAVISMCCVLWHIWKQRNSACFEKKDPNPMATIQQTNSLVSEIIQANTDYIESHATGGPRDSSYNIWRPPRTGVIKINTDAGFNSQKQVGSAGIIGRDGNGDVVFGITRCFPATSSLMAEALAMREPAAVAVNFGLSLVILENDCLDLIRSCRKETKKGEIMNIVADILAYTQTLRDCGFTWVAKEGNRVAHLIAKLSL